MFSRRPARRRPARFAPSLDQLCGRIAPSGGILDPIDIPDYDPSNGYPIDCSRPAEMLRIANVMPVDDTQG
jgi:hypothetical protein